MLRIVPVKFHHAGRHYDFNAQGLDLKPGSRVVVETDRGRALASVVTAPRELPADQAPEGLKSVLRIATDDDVAQAASNATREKAAVRYCMERLQSRNLDMKLVRAEYAFDGSKIVFYFTAEGRVDFRDLVKDLAHHFHTRIEMRQIGVRDEAKLVGGLGICGRELCCCSFLTEFYPVSVKMAKEQGLALNPTKISGQCGRLLCCLGYEFESYCELRKGMPKCGKKVCWNDKEWEVTAQNALGRKITLRQGDGSTRVVTMDEYESGHSSDPEPPAPKAAEQRRPETARPSRSRPSPPRERPTLPPAPPAPAPPPPATQAAEPAAAETAKTGNRRKRRRRRSGRPAAPGEQGE
jgi:cell fate regulator YaaT (PSP1 superfamily)